MKAKHKCMVNGQIGEEVLKCSQRHLRAGANKNARANHTPPSCRFNSPDSGIHCEQVQETENAFCVLQVSHRRCRVTEIWSVANCQGNLVAR